MSKDVRVRIPPPGPFIFKEFMVIGSKIENSELFEKILNRIDVEHNLNDETFTLHCAGQFDYRQRYKNDTLSEISLAQLKFLFAKRSISMLLKSCGLTDYDLFMIECPKDYIEEFSDEQS